MSDLPPSKSQRKRDMHALQDLGTALVELSADQLKRIELPDSLRSAVEEAQRITQHEARRRQMQYIGKLMRTADPEPIKQALDVIAGVSRAETAKLHRLESLRDRFLADESVLSEILVAHPQMDTQHLRQLRRNALKEKQQNKPPRAYRELFRELRKFEEKGGDMDTNEELSDD